MSEQPWRTNKPWSRPGGHLRRVLREDYKPWMDTLDEHGEERIADFYVMAPGSVIIYTHDGKRLTPFHESQRFHEVTQSREAYRDSKDAFQHAEDRVEELHEEERLFIGVLDPEEAVERFNREIKSAYMRLPPGDNKRAENLADVQQRLLNLTGEARALPTDPLFIDIYNGLVEEALPNWRELDVPEPGYRLQRDALRIDDAALEATVTGLVLAKRTRGATVQVRVPGADAYWLNNGLDRFLASIDAPPIPRGYQFSQRVFDLRRAA